jgi:hypothetical protein
MKGIREDGGSCYVVNLTPTTTWSKNVAKETKIVASLSKPTSSHVDSSPEVLREHADIIKPPAPAKLISQLKTILKQKAPSRTTYGRIVSIPDAKRYELTTIAGEITKLCRIIKSQFMSSTPKWTPRSC